MRGVMRFNINNRRRRITTVAYMLLLCFVLFFALSEVYVISQAEHEHNHFGVDGSCSICALFHNTENLLKQFYTVTTDAAFGFVSLLAALLALYAGISLFGFFTPVRLKTRLNN